MILNTFAVLLKFTKGIFEPKLQFPAVCLFTKLLHRVKHWLTKIS